MSEMIALDRIRWDDDARLRLIDSDVVNDYGTRMEAGDRFPPLDVFFDGRDYWLADGFRRFSAARAIGLKVFECIVHGGDARQAKWFGFGSNRTHGERRGRCEVFRILKAILRDEEWAKLPQAQIAEHVGCREELVSTAASSITMGEESEIWNLPEGEYMSWDIPWYCEHLQHGRDGEDFTMVPGMTVHIWPVDRMICSDPSAFPVLPDGARVLVHVAHGVARDNLISALRNLADIFEERWEKIVGDDACSFYEEF